MFPAGIDHHGHFVFEGGIKHLAVPARFQNLEIETRSDSHTDASGYFTGLSDQTFDFRIVWIIADDVGEAVRESLNSLFGERELVASDAARQLLARRRPIVEHGSTDAERI